MNFEELEKNALAKVKKQEEHLENVALFNTQKVLDAFRKYKVSDFYLKPSTGYAYADMGREQLDLIFAEIFKSEAALVRSQFVSGTHALGVALLGNLKAEDELIAVTGSPYDTMQTIIGTPISQKGSLTDLGIKYKEIPMQGNVPDYDKIKKTMNEKTKMIHIQRSSGYSSERESLCVNEIGKIIQVVKKINPNIICFVDNCYGEFTEKIEPTEVGADLVAGSLIKNLGGLPLDK